MVPNGYNGRLVLADDAASIERPSGLSHQAQRVPYDDLRAVRLTRRALRLVPAGAPRTSEVDLQTDPHTLLFKRGSQRDFAEARDFILQKLDELRGTLPDTVMRACPDCGAEFDLITRGPGPGALSCPECDLLLSATPKRP